MGTATHLGPWLLGTVKDTSGTTSGTIRNTGATNSFQTKKLSLVGTVSATPILVAVLPAGAHIINVIVDTLTTLAGTVTAATATVGTLATPDLYWPATTVLTAGRQNATLTATQLTAYAGAASAAAPDGIGIGPTDVLVYFTPTYTTGAPSTNGIVQVTISYLVVNSDGTLGPVA